MGLGERLQHYPQHLSGGEQQRVALARAFVVRPKLLLADEPTGSLDADSGAEVITLLFEMNREYGTTLVLVTHDEGLAQRCARIVRLAGGTDRRREAIPAGCWLRDWRAGELRVLAMALVIAVAAITSVAFFADRVGQALARDAHQLLGADLVLVADQPWPRESRGRDRARAACSSAEAINFISMAFGEGRHARRRQGGDARTIRCAGACASRTGARRSPTRPPSAARRRARCGSKSGW